jgi:hypothetical protein
MPPWLPPATWLAAPAASSAAQPCTNPPGNRFRNSTSARTSSSSADLSRRGSFQLCTASILRDIKKAEQMPLNVMPCGLERPDTSQTVAATGAATGIRSGQRERHPVQRSKRRRLNSSDGQNRSGAHGAAARKTTSPWLHKLLSKNSPT